MKDIFLFNNDFRLVSHKCITCQMPNHDISRCDFIHYLPDKLKIIKNEYYTKNSRKVT